MVRIVADAKMARLAQVLEVFNVLAVKQEKQRMLLVIRVNRVNREHMQLLKQKYVFNVLLDIHKLKKVKQVVLNVYREESIIILVVPIVMNVNLVVFLKCQVGKLAPGVLVVERPVLEVSNALVANLDKLNKEAMM